MDNKPHLVYIGHIGGATGLGRVADALLLRLAEHWRVTVVSLGHPPDYECPYRLVNGIFANDRLGKLVTRKLCETDPPDILVPYFDPSPVIDFLPFMPHDIPVCAYMPIDACNIKDGYKLNRLAHAIFLTEFGLNEARQSGYTGPASVIGHGVDLELFQPKDRHTARAKLQLPQDAFVFGAVNRNQARKRFDVTLYSFREFLQQTRATNAFLYCHCAEEGEGWDLPQLRDFLAREYPLLAQRVLFPPPALVGVAGMAEDMLPYVYSALDVQISTTHGEGFGLTTLEGLACGCPQVVPAFAALAEWAAAICTMVPVRYPMVSTASTNLVEWCVDYREMAATMVRLYAFPPDVRALIGRTGQKFVCQPQFSWDVLAEQFHQVLEGVVQHAAVRV